MYEKKMDSPLIMIMRDWRIYGLDKMRSRSKLWAVTVDSENNVLVELTVHCHKELKEDPVFGRFLSSWQSAGSLSAVVPIELVSNLAAHPETIKLCLARRLRHRGVR